MPGALLRLVSIGLLLGGCGAPLEAAEVVATGSTKQLRDRPASEPQSASDKVPVLILAIDGINRDLLYEMLRAGELPELAKLLGGGKDGQFAHAHFDGSLLATLPSSTMPAWVTALTGVGPAVHGITGNEFFIREQRRFAAPVPVTFTDPEPVFKNFTDGYTNELCLAPSLYQRLRKHDPHAQIWVAMHHYYAGADKLIITDRAVFVKAFEVFIAHELEKRLTGEESRRVYAALDDAVIESVIDELEDDDEPLPDVLTVYVSGTDQFAHVAEVGPDRARREYLREVLDEKIGKLRLALDERRALDNRYVVLTSDHGHTQVKQDDRHALSMDAEGEPPAVLKKLGLRLRPFKEEVAEDHDFQAVLAYQGAMAYVYLADRSSCPKAGQACDWKKPPRFEEDVLPVAEAFHRNNGDGALVKELKGTLDMVLTRKPRPYAEVDLPFQVYVGGGKLQPVGEYLRNKPHPEYVEVERRLKDLAVGPAGERAGDIVLVAKNGNERNPEQRFYFAAWYHSWHGSPAKSDSEIPLIVAHPRKSSQELAGLTREALGKRPAQQRVTDLVLGLRLGRRVDLDSGATQHDQAARAERKPTER